MLLGGLYSFVMLAYKWLPAIPGIKTIGFFSRDKKVKNIKMNVVN